MNAVGLTVDGNLHVLMSSQDIIENIQVQIIDLLKVILRERARSCI